MVMALKKKPDKSWNNIELDIQRESRALFHFERSRLNHLFIEAVRYPLVVVCAGAGYGKTSAVHDFVKEYQAPTAWIQLSERDNIGSRFWENYVHTMGLVDLPFSKAVRKIGFPDTVEKLDQFMEISREFSTSLEKRIIVLDDFHYIEDPLVIRFVERVIQNLSISSMFIISRSTPRLNIAGLVSNGRLFNISESDLRFTEDELAQYFRRQNISTQPDSLREIMHDTEGWAFAINLIARSFQKAPGYGGYLRSAMKTNIFNVMESEIWSGISERVQLFLICLSLIDHLSYDLITLLAGGDDGLIADLERQSAYIRRDSYINAYLLHPLFLEFLAAKQGLLSEEQKRETYSIAGNWCNENGFKIDALFYYEKIGDYASIVALFHALPVQLPYDIPKYATAIFERAPEEAFDTVVSLGIAHARCHVRLGRWDRAIELVKFYEEKYLKLPENDVFRNRNLGGIYLLWGYFRSFMCLNDNVFDFDHYFEKFIKVHPQPASLTKYVTRIRVVGPWIIANSSSKKGAPEDYIKALSRATAILPDSFGGFMAGEDDLAWGELRFFQGDLSEAESYITQTITKAREHKQYEILHRALLYVMRIGIAQGDFEKAEQALKEVKSHLEETEYSNRYINYDITLAIYYYLLGMPDKLPDWIKQSILPYKHASYIENWANQMKVRYSYITRNFSPVLTYIHEVKQRESYLFGRIALIAVEACVHYKMKNKEKAFAAMVEAYQTASPNEIVIPFIELSKNMRTLTGAMLKESKTKIPKAWLENINRKATTYAKRQGHVIAEYKRINRISDGIVLSPRETEILKDISQGLSRADIASSRNLSINTVKMVINNIYVKLGAENLADLIRIAVERKIV